MKKLFILIQALFIYPFLASPVYAAGIDPCVADIKANPFGKVLCNLGTDLGKTIGNIIIAITVIAVIIALLYLVYGGIKWMMSRGEKEQVESARNHIVAAVVGLIVIFLAIFIVSLVLQLFGLQLTQLQIPSLAP